VLLLKLEMLDDVANVRKKPVGNLVHNVRYCLTTLIKQTLTYYETPILLALVLM